MAKTIQIKNKEIIIKDTSIVVEDEVGAEVIQFTIPNGSEIEEYENLTFYIQYKNKDGECGVDTLTNAYPQEVLHEGSFVLNWLPSDIFSKEDGKIEIQIYGENISHEPATGVYVNGVPYYVIINGRYYQVPVYTDTDPTHTPKVGDAIGNNVYTGSANTRWSTKKASLYISENIWDENSIITH